MRALDELAFANDRLYAIEKKDEERDDEDDEDDEWTEETQRVLRISTDFLDEVPAAGATADEVSRFRDEHCTAGKFKPSQSCMAQCQVPDCGQLVAICATSSSELIVADFLAPYPAFHWLHALRNGPKGGVA